MSDRQLQNSGSSAVREGFTLDTGRLGEWMAAHVEDYAGPLTLEQFNGGQSNPTYKLITPDKNYVLRRKPPGQLVAGAHAVDREYRVISALGGAGFPVARTYGFCADDDVIGSSFYVMDCVDGRIVWDASFPGQPVGERAACYDAMNATIAKLHSIDPASIGLSDYGKPGDYFARQISRWTRQYQQDVEAGRVADMDRLVEWLPGNIPPGDEVAIVHGDYRCDNMIFHPTEPRVLAVLDWELSTLGHPLADFAYHLMIYRLPPDLFTGLRDADPAALGLPTEAEYVAAYCARTGRAGIDHLDFYIAFNMFRLTAILHGIRGRLARGTAASAHAAQNASRVEMLAALAWEQAQRAG